MIEQKLPKPSQLCHPTQCVVLLATLFAVCLGDAAFAQSLPDPAKLPPLERKGKAPVIPLDQKSGVKWVPIAAGIQVTTKKGELRVGYELERGKPAGAALAFRPGGLAGLKKLTLELEVAPTAMLSVSVRDTAGAVYSWAPRPVQGTQRLELSVDQLTFDRMQSKAKNPGRFLAEKATLLSVVDIAGFMGGSARKVTWRVRSVKVAVSKAKKKDPAKGDPSDKAPGGKAPGGKAPGGKAPKGKGSDGHDDTKPEEKTKSAVRAESAEERFFRALNHGEGSAEDSLDSLIVAYLAEPSNGRNSLLLGLAHLWQASEGNRLDPRITEHLWLADHYFDRAAELLPNDARIPSWSVPVKVARAELEGNQKRIPAILRELDNAKAEDPCFHGFTVGLLAYGEPAESARFKAGLTAVRETFTCDEDDPSIQNHPRWPHNVEGFLLFAADYERKAGNQEEALRLLSRLEEVPSLASWPYAKEVEARRQEWKSDTVVSQPGGLWMQQHSCRVCHQN